LGRIIGNSYFLSEDADESDREDRREIARLKKSFSLEQTSRKAGSGRGAQDGVAQPTDDVTQAINAIQNRAVKHFQSRFDGYMIRRTISSKNFNGDAIIPLDPYIHVNAVVQLREWERQVINDIGDRASDGSVHIHNAEH
jgi:hypothetical protein